MSDSNNSLESTITNIPFELLLHIFSFLPAADIVRFLNTSKSYHTLAKDQSIWRDLCARYGVDDLTPFRFHDTRRSYYTLYTTLLHKYGPLLGLWASDNPFQGNILQFRVVSESWDVGWEGIIGEVWRFDPGRTMKQRVPLLPEYYECLRIELYPVETCDGLSESQAAVRFAWAVHDIKSMIRKAPVIRTSSTDIVRRNAVHQQAFYVCSVPLRSNLPALHPVFPPPSLSDFLEDPNRLPRLRQYHELPIEHSLFLSDVPWDEADNVSIFYLGPAPKESVPGPRSITILPPVTQIEASRHWDLLLPQRPSVILDMRVELNMVYSRPFMGHYFPLSVPSPPPRSAYSDWPLPVISPWSPRDLEGLWLGAYSTDGTEMLLLRWESQLNEIQAWKMTGNCCVPRGALSWKFDLNAPISTNDNAQLISDLAVDIEDERSVDWSGLKIFEGSGIIADEGYMESSRGNLMLEVSVRSVYDIRIRWTYEDGGRGVLTYKRYLGRKITAEEVVSPGVRRARGSKLA